MEIVLNGKPCKCVADETVLEVAKRNNIFIPTLCYLKNVCEESSCRICVCEVDGRLRPVCSLPVEDGMVVKTESEKVLNSRKHTLQLFLENHHRNCNQCQKNHDCDLQNLFEMYNILPERHDFYKVEVDNSSPCVTRDDSKCILCNKCAKICANTQSVHALTKQQRGYKTFMGCAFDSELRHSTCVGCGQCTLVCPTGALVEHSELDNVTQVLTTDKIVIAQVAPSVRVSLAEAFSNPIGTFDEGRMVTALKKIGFKYVFDVNLGADFTVIEESKELLERVKSGKDLPLFSSCCPAWFKFVQNFYPDYANHISSCKSPTEMLGAIIKNYYNKKLGVSADDIVVVGIMPCTAKKGEKQRGKDVDFVLTTRELAKLIKLFDIDYNNLPSSPFDSPLSYYSGAGLIFGATGGVTEAVLRNVLSQLDPQNTQIDFENVRKSDGRKEVEISAKNTKLHLCIVNGLANARKVMEDIASGKKHYDFVEVMACPGGCVNGGGQIYVDYQKIDIQDVKLARANSLYQKDKHMKERKSSQNTSMQQIYDDFFIPSPQMAKQLLHYRH